ncbi:MAG: lysophospholipid acyltransferase family protein [Burkholderiales bacterium]
MNFIRSAFYVLVLAIITPIIAFAMAIVMPFTKRSAPFRLAKLWTQMAIFSLRWICGIKEEIRGAENVPSTPTIVMAKHQSSWETVFFVTYFPEHTWVIKQELVRVPFFGWGIAMLTPVAIDRSAGKDSLQQVVEQGAKRLEEGLWMMIWPEGHRIAPDKKGRYKIGGAWLAAQTNTPILPVAHNAGTYWPRHWFWKTPGTITMSIGPLIHPNGREPSEILTEVETWIENEMHRISPSYVGTPAEPVYAETAAR